MAIIVSKYHHISSFIGSMVVDQNKFKKIKNQKKRRKKVSACGIFAAIISIISITATISNTVITILIAVHWLSDFSAPRIKQQNCVNHP